MYLTTIGYDKYKKELQDLTGALPAMIKETGAMAALGDRSENAGYINAKQVMRKTQARIRYLEDLLKHSKIISENNTDSISIGSKVLLKNLTNNLNVEYKIVDSIEANPVDNLISFHSPLGKLLIGKKCGDRIYLQTDFYTTEYNILEIK